MEHRGKIARAVAAALAAVALAVLGPGAQAAAAAPTDVDVINGGLFVKAQPETVNRITLSFAVAQSEIRVSDTAGALVPAPTEADPEPSPCRQISLTEVGCPVAALVRQPSSASIGVVLGDSDDTLSGAGLGADLGFAATGGAGSDELAGGPARDTLLGGDGNDSVRGASGNDLIGGDAGNDVLRGEADNDVIGGGPGHDRQFGGRGHDWIWTADKQRDPVINCGPGRDRPAIIDRGKDAQPRSC